MVICKANGEIMDFHEISFKNNEKNELEFPKSLFTGHASLLEIMQEMKCKARKNIKIK